MAPNRAAADSGRTTRAADSGDQPA